MSLTKHTSGRGGSKYPYHPLCPLCLVPLYVLTDGNRYGIVCPHEDPPEAALPLTLLIQTTRRCALHGAVKGLIQRYRQQLSHLIASSLVYDHLHYTVETWDLIFLATVLTFSPGWIQSWAALLHQPHHS